MNNFTSLFCLLFLTLSLQAQVSKTVSISAGGLSSALTKAEKSSITNLTITGTIDARDFKIMRDSMAVLSVLNISNASVASYTGTQEQLVLAVKPTRYIQYPKQHLTRKEALKALFFQTI